jgi:hypothetical protein
MSLRFGLTNSLKTLCSAIKLLFLFVVCQNAKSQHTAKWGVEYQQHYGFLMAHHPHMHILNTQHFGLQQINLFKQATASHWQQLYNYPKYGLAIVQSSLSSPQNIGYGFAVIPFIRFPWLKTQNAKLSFHVGCGVGYIQKPFHHIHNYKNSAIGSQLNAALQGQLNYSYRFKTKHEINAGIAITHFSNGKIKTPNLGLNNLSAFVGYAHLFPLKETLENKEHNVQFNPQLEKNIFFAASVKQKYPIGGPNYFYGAASFNIKKPLSLKRKLGLGVDVFYDFSDKASLIEKGHEEDALAYVKTGIYAAHDWNFHRMSIFMHIGTYLYVLENNQNQGKIYQRVGVQHQLSQSISTFLALKSHFAKADCIEFGVQYSFHKSYD